MTQRDGHQPSGRARAARFASVGLGLTLAFAAAAAPAVAEAHVRQQLREQLGVDDSFSIDLDLGGLELRGLSRTLSHGRGQLSAERVHIRPTFRGFVIEIDGLDGVLRRRVADPNPRPVAPPAAPSPSASPAPDPVAELLIRLRGVPIALVSHGQIEVELSDGLRATAKDPRLELPGDGRVLGHTQVLLGGSASDGATPWARATLDLATLDERPRELEFHGNVDLDGDLRSLQISGRASSSRASMALVEPAGGLANIDIQRNVEPGRDRLAIDAQALPLDLLAPLAQLFGQQIGGAIGERDGRVTLDQTEISGTVELVHGGGLTRAHFDQVELSTLTVDSDLLAPDPVEFTDLRLDGDLARERTATGSRGFGQLTLGHAGVTLQLSGQADPTRIVFDVELPTTPCQAVLDALPGAPAALAGTELRGDLDAHFGFTLDYAELERSRAHYLGPDAEPLELEDFVAPGEVRFALPYLERCTIARLGPGVDVVGLAGPYRHRFVTGSGAEKRRVLALGDADYVTLASVPELALGFVILEDSRFWRHDGFDREQIERAFWFNVLERRVSRGASTISQQTTRSLWLGIDRSIARKLAEAMLTAELERGLDKRRILEIYLNIIELGPEVHGVAEAARYHFGKSPTELSLLEALHLASMAPAPVAYSRRFASGTVDARWQDHLRQQIRRLRMRGLISPEQANEALRARLEVRPHPELLAPSTAAP